MGDGRAINIAELEIKEINWKFQLKGTGLTPYSRGADGLAAQCYRVVLKINKNKKYE